MPFDFEPYEPSTAESKDSFQFEAYEPEAKPSSNDVLGMRQQVKDFAGAAAPSVEALAGMVAGIPGQVAGGLYGLSTLAAGQGLDKANANMQKVQNALSYKPFNKDTPEYQENLAKTMAKPGEWAEEGARKLGMNELGATNAKVATDVLMNLVDPLVAGKALVGKRGSTAALPKEAPKEPATRVDSVLEKSQPKFDFEPFEGQGDLFGGERGTLADQGPQFDPSAPVSPSRGELSNARQMDLPVGEPGMPATMTATPDGILAARPDAELFAHRDRAEQGLVNRLDAENAPLAAERARQQALAEYQAKLDSIEQQRTARQADMEQQVKRQTTLEQNAAARQRMENAPVPRSEFDAHQAQLKQQVELAEQQRLAMESQRAQGMHQTLIDDTQHVLPDTNEVIAPQYGAMQGVGRLDENGMPIRADLSMEAHNLENPLQRNLWGDELGPALGQERSLTDALDSMQKTPFVGDAREVALERLGKPMEPTQMYGGAPESKEGQFRVSTSDSGFTVHDKNGKQVGRLESNMTPEQNASLGYDKDFPASIDIVKVDPAVKGQGAGQALYKAFFDAHQGNVMPSGKTTQDAWNVWKRSYPAKVEEFIGSEAKRIQDGAPASQVLSNITDPEIRTKVAEYAEGKNSAQMAAKYEPSAIPFNTRTRKQGGGILIPGLDKGKLEALRKIPGFEGPLRHLTPDVLPTAEFMEKFKDTPDVKQNVAQKAMNGLTKGGQYASIRMDDPFVKRATQRVRTAVNNSQAAIRDLIHSDTGYAPTLRKLNKDEYIETAQLLQKADKANTPINLEAMREAGFSERAIDMVKTHQEYAQKLEGPLKEAASMAGIQNVSMRNAYAASRAMGDYRAPIMKDGQVVGIVTANTKFGLDSKLKSLNKLPNSEGYTAAPAKYYGQGRGRVNPEGMSQLYEWLSDQNPEVAAFSDILTQMNEQTAANYLNAKRHTMAKKGVFGMAGDDAFKGAYENAKDFWESQVKYGESVIKWSEMSKAAQDNAPLYSMPDRPNANKYIEDYTANAMGKNPSQIGSAIDHLTGSLGDAFGVGTTIPGKITGVGKKAINMALLSLSPRFLLTNILQPLRAMPELSSFMKSKGLDVNAFGADNFMKGFMDAANVTGKHDPIVQGALKYAHDNHVYSSDLFETTNRTRKDIPYYLDKLQAPASSIEYGTRKGVYLATVDMLNKNGMTPESGLYQTAHNVTDMFMNNYNSSETPMAYNTLGKGLGRTSSNLMSYKHNELSRIAMHFEEAKNNKLMRPLMVSFMAQAAIGGLMGVIGYNEANWVVQKLGNLLGKPTSITKVLMEDTSIPDVVKFGVPAAAGVDTSSAFGMDILPNASSPLDMVMPGASFLSNAAGSAASAAMNPTEYNLKKAAFDAAPIGPVKNMLEQKFFTGDNGMAINPNTAKATVQRTEGDQLAKSLGFTGLNESKEKKLNYERDRIDQFYNDKRKDALLNLRESLVTNNKADMQQAIQKFVKAQGDPSNLQSTLEQMVKDKSISAGDRIILNNQSGKIDSVYKLQRRAN